MIFFCPIMRRLLKQASQDVTPSTSGSPRAFIAADTKITRVYVDALSVPLQAEGDPYCCLCFHETVSPPRSAKAGHGLLAMVCYWGTCTLLFAEVRISLTTIYGSEDANGFPYSENYLEIGSAMLSLVRYYYQRTIQTTSADRATIIIIR